MTNSFLAEPPRAPRLFSTRAVGVGALVGGPIAAGTMIGLNYRRLGNSRACWYAFAGGALLTALMFWGLFNVPSEIVDRIPRQLMPAIYGPLAGYLAARLQGDGIRKAIEGGARKASAWAVAGWSIGSVVVTLGMIVPFALASPPLGFHGEKLAFGPHGAYEIYFAKGVDEPRREAVEKYLEHTGYFEGGNERPAQVDQQRGAYIVSLAIVRENWDKPDLLQYLGTVRADLEQFVLKGKVSLLLVDQDFARTYRKAIPSGSSQ